MVLSPTLQALLDRLDPSQRIDFANLAEAIYAARYTGTTLIHWRNGKPQQVDLGAPIRLSIVEGQQPGVDKQGGNSSG